MLGKFSKANGRRGERGFEFICACLDVFDRYLLILNGLFEYPSRHEEFGGKNIGFDLNRAGLVVADIFGRALENLRDTFVQEPM